MGSDLAPLLVRCLLISCPICVAMWCSPARNRGAPQVLTVGRKGKKGLCPVFTLHLAHSRNLMSMTILYMVRIYIVLGGYKWTVLTAQIGVLCLVIHSFKKHFCTRYCYQELRNHQGIKLSPFIALILGVQMEKRWNKKK